MIKQRIKLVDKPLEGVNRVRCGELARENGELYTGSYTSSTNDPIKINTGKAGFTLSANIQLNGYSINTPSVRHYFMRFNVQPQQNGFLMLVDGVRHTS